jgi:UDP-N-acetylmuramate dehydrogenase
LVSDNGFDGLVIKIQNSRLRPTGGQAKKIIYAGAGVYLAELIKFSTSKNLTGLEWAIGIPKITVGGAIVSNAGAFGKSMSEIIQKVIILDEKSQVANYNFKDCKFGYRESVFKHKKNLIILAAEIKLEKGDSKVSREKIREYIKKRKSSQPLEYPSAGSIFKNISFSEILPETLNKCPMLEEFREAGKVPAGWLIEAVGLKGKKIGQAQISEKHANFIINTGNARAEDVIILISLTKQKVRNKFGLQLMEEIEYVGF